MKEKNYLNNFRRVCRKHWKNWTSSTVWKVYFQNISPRIFPYHGKYFHTMELDKTLEIGFFNLFYNIYKIFPYYGRGLIFSVKVSKPLLPSFRPNCSDFPTLSQTLIYKFTTLFQTIYLTREQLVFHELQNQLDVPFL